MRGEELSPQQLVYGERLGPSRAWELTSGISPASAPSATGCAAETSPPSAQPLCPPNLHPLPSFEWTGGLPSPTHSLTPSPSGPPAPPLHLLGAEQGIAGVIGSEHPHHPSTCWWDTGFTPCQDAPDQLCTGMGDMGEIPASPGQAHGTQLRLSDTGALAPTVWHSKGAEGGLQALLRGLQRAYLACAGHGGKGGDTQPGRGHTKSGNTRFTSLPAPRPPRGGWLLLQ